MPRLYLPIRRIEVTKNGRKMKVFIPDTGDKGEMEELEAIEREKTEEELKKAPPRPKRIVPREEVGQALNEFNKYLKRKRENPNPKYF